MPINPEHEYYALLSKLSSWASLLFIGLVGKVSYELSKGKKLAWYHWIGMAGLSMFVGWMALEWCDIYGLHDQKNLIGPVATLFGDRIVLFIVAKHQEILQSILSSFIKKK